MAANNALSGAAAWRAKWAARLSALFSRPAGKPAKVTLPAPARLPVQGQLALDRIKVVRNDLSDADLEVVPARLPITKVKTAPAVAGLPDSPGGRRDDAGSPVRGLSHRAEADSERTDAKCPTSRTHR